MRIFMLSFHSHTPTLFYSRTEKPGAEKHVTIQIYFSSTLKTQRCRHKCAQCLATTIFAEVI